MDDFVFTFDVNPFMTAMDQISDGFNSLKSSLVSFSDSFQKKSDQTAQATSERVKRSSKHLKKTNETNIANFSDNASKMIGALTKRLAALGAAYLSFKALLSQIPEIGTAFKSAGNIFLRNFLWPLRQYLLPLLQKMLAWVRDNRSMFVKWGTVLVSAFKVVAQIVKGLFNLVKSFVSGFSNTFKRIFGITTKSISDMINLLLFKVTVLAQFILITLEPVFKKIGEAIATLMGYFKTLAKGFAESFGNISEPFNQLKEVLNDIFESITMNKDLTVNWGEAFRKTGLIIGASLKYSLTILIGIIDTLQIAIRTIVKAAQAFGALYSGDLDKLNIIWKGTQKLFSDYGLRLKGYNEGIMKSQKRFQESWKKGSIFKENTKETEKITEKIPIRSPRGIINNKTESKVNATYNINVTTPSEAKAVGENLARGHADYYRILHDEIIRSQEGVAHSR